MSEKRERRESPARRARGKKAGEKTQTAYLPRGGDSKRGDKGRDLKRRKQGGKSKKKVKKFIAKKKKKELQNGKKTRVSSQQTVSKIAHIKKGDRG